MNSQPATSVVENYCLFDADFGPCALAWSERGLTHVQLPEKDRAATERRMRTRAPGAVAAEPPPAIRDLIALMRRYFAGEQVDFSAVSVDVPQVSALHRKIYEAARAISWGRTASYGELARAVGAPQEAREVGQAMARNRVPIVVPCHRVLASGGKIGGFSAPGGTVTKERLLWLEGVRVGDAAPLLPGFLPLQRRGERPR